MYWNPNPPVESMIQPKHCCFVSSDTCDFFKLAFATPTSLENVAEVYHWSTWARYFYLLILYIGIPPHKVQSSYTLIIKKICRWKLRPCDGAVYIQSISTSSMNLNDWSLNYCSSSMIIFLAICPKINYSPSGGVIVKQVKLMAVISANGKITSMPKVDYTLRRGRYECQWVAILKKLSASKTLEVDWWMMSRYR